MTNAGAVSQRLEPELTTTPEWHSVSSRQHNAILQGPEHATERLLLLLQPYIRTPAIWTRAPLPLDPPTYECGALVLRNVRALDRREQAALSRWLDAERRQVISTTTHPLFPLVEAGLFDQELYYRLNIVLMRIDSADAPA